LPGRPLAWPGSALTFGLAVAAFLVFVLGRRRDVTKGIAGLGETCTTLGRSIPPPRQLRAARFSLGLGRAYALIVCVFVAGQSRGSGAKDESSAERDLRLAEHCRISILSVEPCRLTDMYFVRMSTEVTSPLAEHRRDKTNVKAKALFRGERRLGHIRWSTLCAQRSLTFDCVVIENSHRPEIRSECSLHIDTLDLRPWSALRDDATAALGMNRTWCNRYAQRREQLSGTSDREVTSLTDCRRS